MGTRNIGNGPLRILDSTLREGEQFADAHFTQADRARLALALDASGIDELELPSPAVSRSATASVAEIIQLRLAAQVRVHLRCHPADIEMALAAGATGLNLFLGTSPALAGQSLRRSWPQLARQIRDAVGLAVSAGAFVRFSAEDAFRTPRPRLLAAFDVAVEAGARRLGVPHTVGIATPAMVGATVRAVRRALWVGSGGAQVPGATALPAGAELPGAPPLPTRPDRRGAWGGALAGAGG